MAKKSASEVFSSPEAASSLSRPGEVLSDWSGGDKNPITAHVGGLVNKLRGGGNPFKEAAKEQDQRYDDAYDKAKDAVVTTDGTSTSTTKGGTTSSSQTTFAPRGPEEQALLNASIDNFGKQGVLVDNAEKSITERLGTQTGARDTLGGIFSGQAFDLTDSENARINNLRNADISASSNAVNELLDRRLAETSADAARRGVRGQAFSQLQGDAIRSSAQELNRATLDANRTAAGNAIAMPGQRVGIQAGSAGQFANFSDAAAQQAIDNRKALQDPVAAQQLLDERLRGGVTTGTTNTDQTTTGANNQATTGGGAADILAAQAGSPGQKGAATAGGLETVGTILKGVAAVV